jgi:hypothetical protein
VIPRREERGGTQREKGPGRLSRVKTSGYLVLALRCGGLRRVGFDLLKT